MIAQYIIIGLVGVIIGVVATIISKLQLSANWSNKEFDGTMFIFVILMAFCGTMLGTYLKESFAGLESTKAALDLFENLFMIVVGYLFKKAADAVVGGNGGQKQ